MPSTEFCSGCGRGARERDRYCRGCGMLLDEAMAGEPIAEAEAYAAAGQLAQAVATIQRAIGTAESADLQIALCTLYLRRGGQGDARRALDRALALDANSAVAHAYIAGLDMHAGRVAEAQERLDHALSLAPDDLIVRIKRAEYWLRLGIFDNAKLELRQALQNGGGSAQNRAMAEMMFASIEKRSRGSFTRKTMTLPSLRPIKRLLRRTDTAAVTAAEVEG